MSQTQSKLINKPKPKTAWAKPDRLSLRGFQKEPGYRYRLVRLDENTTFINGQDPRGWEIVKVQKNETDTFTGSISQFSKTALDSVLRVGNLVLCRMPEDAAQERNAYYAQMHRAKAEASPKSKETDPRVKAHLTEDDDEELNSKLKPVRGQGLL